MKIVGMMCVKNEARWIADVLRGMWFCHRILLMDDHSTDGTVSIAEMFSNVEVLPSPFLDYDEPRNNTWLLKKVAGLEPDWVMHTMGDEVVEFDTWIKIQPLLHDPDYSTIRFRVINLWDGIFMARTDGQWAKREADTLWRWSHRSLTYTGMHCGLPDGFEIRPHPDARLVPNATLRHYGYCSRTLRQEAYYFFMARDKNAVRLAGYRDLLAEPSDVILEYIGP